MNLLLLFNQRAAAAPIVVSTETAGLTGTIIVAPLNNGLALSSTNTVTLKGLRNDVTKLYPIDATVVFTALLDATGALVLGTQNISMPYISGIGRKSLYRCGIPHTVVLAPGTYTARVTATDTTGDVRVLNRACVAKAG